MRVTLIILFITLLFSSLVYAGPTSDSINYQVQNLYKDPDPDSLQIYKIPIELKLLDFSEDANWYKVKIEYKLGVVKLQHIGWAYIPVGEIINKRAAEKQKQGKEVIQ